MFASKNQKTVTCLVFGFYLFLLLWLILFKFSTDLSALSRMRSVNLLPFGETLTVNGAVAWKEVVWNGLIFVPFGAYLGLLFPRWSWPGKAAVCLGFSVLLETVQFLFALGASDVTDVLSNTAGGLLGIGVYTCLKKAFPRNYSAVMNGIGAGVEVTAFLLLGVLFLANR